MINAIGRVDGEEVLVVGFDEQSIRELQAGQQILLQGNGPGLLFVYGLTDEALRHLLDSKGPRELVAAARNVESVSRSLGPVGEYPDGKLGPTDSGALVMAVSVDHGRVVIDFGTQVTWLAWSPDEAEGFANAILKVARAARVTRRATS